MTRVLSRLLVVLVLGCFASGQEAGEEGYSIERSFAEGGTVRLHLASGDYTLRAGASDRVLVSWSPDDEARAKDLKELKVDVDLAGSIATILTEGSTKHVEFTIEIPARSDLHLRMRAGDVRVEGIEGHKDIRMTAGDLRIGIRPELLSRARASVTFGDLDARPLGVSTGGIKRSLRWTGTGEYTLDARLFAGDLTLSDQR